MKAFWNNFWKGIERDDKEIAKIEKMIERKEAKKVGHWLKKWEREGRFWDKEDKRDAKFQDKADRF